jgi:DNA mismatch repair protein MutL
LSDARRVVVLDDTVVDRIAAGEVVERPASVLKELVENALDAGATELTIELKAGGVTLLSVTDNGGGMSAQDAQTAIKRHATSKIRAAADLVGVVTYGFRGEALPSIASVSRFELRTRRAEDELGTSIRIDGGRVERVEPVASPVGTKVEVRSLFHHVPARRKFLRGKQTELGHCTEAVRRALLIRPDVAVRVIHDGRELLRAPRTESLATRARDLLGDAAKMLVPVDAGDDDIRIRGLTSPIGVHRPSSTGSIYLYVGGRFVRDPVLRRALSDGYRGAVPPGRYPVVVLDVSVPPEQLDVNVHPAKTEVRFSAAAVVSRVFSDTVRDAVRGSVKRVAPTPSRGEVPAPPEAQTVLDVPVAPEPPPMRVSPHPDDDPHLRAVSEVLGREDEPEPLVLAPPVAAEPAPAPLDPPAPVETPSRWRALRPEWVLPGGLVVAAREDDTVLVDVRALHRAWVRGRLASGDARTRPLLAPAIVSLDATEAIAVLAKVETFAEHGVDVRAFGPGTLAVMAVPELVRIDDPDALLRAAGADDLLDALAALAVDPPDTPHGVATLFATLDESAALPLEPPWLRVFDADDLRAWIGRG